MGDEQDGYAQFFERLDEALKDTAAQAAKLPKDKAALVEDAVHEIQRMMWPGPGIPDTYWRERDEEAVSRRLCGLSRAEFDEIAPYLSKVLEVYAVRRTLRYTPQSL